MNRTLLTRMTRILMTLPILMGLLACGGNSGDPGSSGESIPTSAAEPSTVYRGDPLSPRGSSIYVDGDNGSDSTGDGAIDNPFASINQGLLAAQALVQATNPVVNQVDVYVARRANDAAYEERPGNPRRRIFPLHIASGVSLYGGYDAADWRRNPGDRSRIEGWANTLGFAKQMNGDVALVGFDIKSDNSQLDSIAVSAVPAEKGTATIAIDDCVIHSGDSALGHSIALQITNQQGFRLANSVVVSGNGGAGGDGSNITAPGADGEDGEWGGDIDAMTPTSQDWEEGGIGGSVAGLPAHHRGGNGGDGGNDEFEFGRVEFGHDGRDGGNGAGGSGGDGGWMEAGFPFDTHSPLNGGNGADGRDGLQGGGGNGSGGFGGSRHLWQASNGFEGARGEAGYGGGGGGGARAIGGGLLEVKEGSGGGGGGSGAEGGRGGSSGQGGNASIAVALANVTMVLLENNELRSNHGGHGGNGGTGSPGGTGGEGAGSAFQNGHLQGAEGGDGGDGGHGGGGGGGGGGPSFAVMLGDSVSPILRSNDLYTGDAGNGGLAGLSGRTHGVAAGEGGYSVGVFAIDTGNIPVMEGNQFFIGAAGSSPDIGRAGISANTNF